MALDDKGIWREEAVGVAGWRTLADPNQICLDEACYVLDVCAAGHELELELVFHELVTGFDPARVPAISAAGDTENGDVVLATFGGSARLRFEPRAYRGYGDVSRAEDEPAGEPLDVEPSDEERLEDAGEDVGLPENFRWLGAGVGQISLAVPWLRQTATALSTGTGIAEILASYSRLTRTIGLDLNPKPTVHRLAASSVLLMSPVRTRLEQAIVAGRVPRESHAALHYYHRPTRVVAARFQASVSWISRQCLASPECSSRLARWLERWVK